MNRIKRRIKRIRIRKICASRVEWKYIYQLTDAIGRDDIRNYVLNQIEWYVIKANRYRFYEYALKILAVIMPTFIMLFQQCMQQCGKLQEPCIQAIVLGGATITTASSNFVKWHDKRVLYRKSAELIKEETMLYITWAGMYHDEKRDEKFVMKLNEIANSTNDKWEILEEENKSDTRQQGRK